MPYRCTYAAKYRHMNHQQGAAIWFLFPQIPFTLILGPDPQPSHSTPTRTVSPRARRSRCAMPWRFRKLRALRSSDSTCPKREAREAREAVRPNARRFGRNAGDESLANPTKMVVIPEPCKELRRISAISGWDCPLLTFYPGFECGSDGPQVN